MTNELAELCETVLTAGKAVLRILQDGFETSHKANRDPVTTADVEANRVLQERLIRHGSDTGGCPRKLKTNQTVSRKKEFGLWTRSTGRRNL
jgi:3'-phosphoadenosine 5'-phosphosulfate (PAPS) 3'-phosphatase